MVWVLVLTMTHPALPDIVTRQPAKSELACRNAAVFALEQSIRRFDPKRDQLLITKAECEQEHP